MSISLQRRTLWRAGLHLLTTLALVGMMMMTSETPVSAQQCAPGCSPLTIYNCTWRPVAYKIKFFLCCNGVQSVSPTFVIPAATTPPPPCAVITYVPPSTSTTCLTPTVIGVAGISPAPPGGYIFDLATCTLRIF